MAKILTIIAEWFLKNSVKKILAGAGLGIFTYLGIVVAIRAAFDLLIQDVNSISADVLALMGIYGIDKVISAFISVAIFLLTLNNGKLIIKGTGR